MNKDIKAVKERLKRNHKHDTSNHIDFVTVDPDDLQVLITDHDRLEKEHSEFHLEKAAQQLIGFQHARHGYDVESLCQSMDLSRNEFEVLIKNGDIDFLDNKILNEIDESLPTSNMSNPVPTPPTEDKNDG